MHLNLRFLISKSQRKVFGGCLPAAGPPVQAGYPPHEGELGQKVEN
jgi:hypothetical protein